MSKQKSVPKFLYDVLGGDTSQYAADVKFIFSNWLKIHAFIRNVPNSREGMRTMAKLMIAEYMRRPGPRMDIVVRLHGRLNRIRYEVERVELGARK